MVVVFPHQFKLTIPPQPGWLMRILGPFVLILLLEVIDTRYHFSSRRAIALQLVCDEQTRDIPQSLQ